METVSLSKIAYNNLIKKARMAEQFFAFLEKEYPKEEYDKKRIQEFMSNDRVSSRLKKDITAIAAQFRKSA